MNSETYLEKADGFIESNDKKSAIEVLKEALELFPNDSWVLLKLAEVYRQGNELESSEKIYDTLCTTPSQIEEYIIDYNTALVKFSLEKYPEALELFRKYLKAPNNEKAFIPHARGYIMNCLTKMTEGNPEYVHIGKKLYPDGKAWVSVNCPKKYEDQVSNAIRQTVCNDISINKQRFYETLQGNGIPKEEIDDVYESLSMMDESWAYVYVY